MKKNIYLVFFLSILFFPVIVNAESKYLYDVLKEKAESGGLAKEYTGRHHDSFTKEPSKKIYYMNSSEDNLLNLNNNVAFGGFCWELVRTTDTGGVKVVYNGIAKDRYDIIPYDKDEYTFGNGSSSFIWNETDKTWNTTIEAKAGAGLTIVPTEAKEYVVEITVIPEYPPFKGGYININNTNDNNSYELLNNLDYGYVQYDYGIRTLDSSFNVNYSGYDSTFVGNVSIKIKVGKKGNVVGKICNNKSSTERSIGRLKFNEYQNSVAYVGYMHNPSLALFYKGWSSGRNMIFGNDVAYSNGQYTLTDTSSTLDNTHHYTCLSSSTTCEKVAYFYYNYYYTELTNGLKIEDAVHNMLDSDNVNQQDSTVKAFIDEWYQNNLTEYTEYLEDTIFCNNREVIDYAGWEKNGSLSKSAGMLFRDYKDSEDLSCPNITDQFSLANSKAQLTYPVAMLTSPERNLIGTTNFTYYTDEWLLTPYSISDGYIEAKVMRWNGGNQYGSVVQYSSNDVRPTISFIPNIEYRSGNGQKYSPYQIKIPSISNITINNEDEKGIIEINNVQNIEEDSMVKFKVVPNFGYEIARIDIKKADDELVEYQATENADEYSFIMPDSDVTITPIYEKVKSSVNVEIVNETEDVNIELDDMTRVEYEEKVIFKVKPIKGYKIKWISIIDSVGNEINYSETDNKNEYTFIMPASNVTIIPSYERVSSSVNIEDDKNTKEIIIEVNDAKAVIYEDTVKFMIIPEEGYEVEKIDIRDQENNNIEYRKTDKDNEYEFVMPDTDVVIIPKYKKIKSNDTLKNPNTGNRILSIMLLIILCLGVGTFIYKRKESR